MREEFSQLFDDLGLVDVLSQIQVHFLGSVVDFQPDARHPCEKTTQDSVQSIFY